MEKKRTVQEIKNDLEKAKERFLDVMKRGDKALSEYDLSYGYDADFYLNRVSLLRNHIIYHNRELKKP